ncbi:hypothetical protein [Pseudomonas sp. dw_358]|uniref:hypothetical protein n=1 Tax=Pseudomonas sp. dw_358 TaxID=2720083 RepID=UPI001BD2F539|nr:hypothetical protein [Pseudomonas sp. dw_358]
MSIHARLSRDLDALNHPATPRFHERRVENRIIQALQENEIDTEDFHYYSARLRRVCEQRKEAA